MREQGLEQQDGAVEGVHGDGHRHPKLLLQHQGRDVHAAGGGPGPDHHPDAHADEQAAAHGGQQGVAGEPHPLELPLEDLQHQGEVEGADGRGEGEDLSQQAQAHHEHGGVEDPHKGGKGQAQQVLGHQPQAGGAPGDQPGGQHEQGDGQGV